LGDGQEHGDDPNRDAIEAEALYELLEREVVPQFYSRDSQGIPGAWVARMRASMAQLTGRFSANRAVREYTEMFYLPAAKAYRERTSAKGAAAEQIVRWRGALADKWSAVRFGEVKARLEGGQHLFEAQVYLDGLDPGVVRVEIYANGSGDDAPVRQEMQPLRPLVGTENAWAYGAGVPSARPASDYTARIVPKHAGVAIPLEAGFIVWQR
jgi:starch phosphorylase